MAAETTPQARWKRIAGYCLFGFFAFALCLALTFPYGAIRARIVTEAAAQGFAVRIGSIRPGLRGLTATNVRISKPPSPLRAEVLGTLLEGDSEALALVPPSELGEALEVSSVALRPSLFPIGVAFHASALEGTVAGSVGSLGALSAQVELEGLNAGSGNLKGFTGMELEGTLEGELSLKVPLGSGAGAAAQGYDFSQANGQLALDTSRLVIKGGTVTVPIYGTPTPVDLPRVALGDVRAELKIVDGLGTLEQLQGKSEDLELRGQGTVKFARRFEYSEPAIDLRIKADPAFTKRLGLIGSGLSVLPADRKDPSFRVARLSGYLGRPKFGPGSR